jgi:hypothetical protein
MNDKGAWGNPEGTDVVRALYLRLHQHPPFLVFLNSGVTGIILFFFLERALML